MSTPSRILLPAAVDPRALSDYCSADHGMTHEAMVIALIDHATLTLGEGDARALFSAIDSLESQYSRAQWNELLIALSRLNRLDDKETRPDSLKMFLAELELREDAGECVRLAIVGKSDAGQSENNLLSGTHEVNGTELVRPPHLSHAVALKYAREIGSFAENTPRDAIADELILPLAARSRVVKIMDPYLMEHVLRTAKGRPYDHAEWLVKVLAGAMPDGASIELITDRNNGPTITDGGEEVSLTDVIATRLISEAIGQALDASGATQIKARTTLVRAHPKKNPNRYLWFSCGVAFEVSHDFARLGRPLIWERVKFTRQRGDDADHVAKIAESYERFAPAAAKLQVKVST